MRCLVRFLRVGGRLFGIIDSLLMVVFSFRRLGVIWSDNTYRHFVRSLVGFLAWSWLLEVI